MATPTLPTEQFNPKSLYTITGAAAAVWLFGAVLFTVLGNKADEIIYRAIAFGLSIAIAIGMLVEKKKFGVKYWLLVIPNSALIFVNASGYNAVNNGSIGTPGVEKVEASISFPVNQNMQQATFLPFLKDVAWWPDPVLNEKIEQLKKTKDSLITENKIMSQKIATIETGNSSNTLEYKNKIAALETQLQTLQQENTALRSGNQNTADLSATIQKLNTTITGLRKQVTDKDNQLKNCTGDLQKTKTALAATTNQLNDCLKKGDSYQALNNRITALNTQLAQSKSSLDACNSKLNEALGTIKSLENKLKNCNTKPGDPDGSPVVLDLQDKVRSLEKDLVNVKGQLSKCQTALTEANSRNSGGDSKQIYELQSKLNTCNGELEKCNSQLRNYQNQYKTLTGQLGSVRDSLNRCLNPKQIIKTQIPKGN